MSKKISDVSGNTLTDNPNVCSMWMEWKLKFWRVLNKKIGIFIKNPSKAGSAYIFWHGCPAQYKAPPSVSSRKATNGINKLRCLSMNSGVMINGIDPSFTVSHIYVVPGFWAPTFDQVGWLLAVSRRFAFALWDIRIHFVYVVVPGWRKMSPVKNQFLQCHWVDLQLVMAFR